MNTKNDVEVIINGKQYTLSGYESSEYLQKIANHINDKIAEFKEQDGYLRLDTEMKNILLAINLSDEYYKALKDSNDIKKENEEMEYLLPVACRSISNCNFKNIVYGRSETR